MICKTSCLIASIFIVSMIYKTFFYDEEILNTFNNVLNNKQREIYIKIINERRRIYFTGFSLGFALSLLFIFLKSYKNIKIQKIPFVCITITITYLITYLYYILSPKTTYMLEHLNNQEQVKAWLNVYKKMQFNFHFGLLLGLIGVGFLSVSVCK